MARPKDKSKIDIIYQATLKLVLKTGFNGLKMADVAKVAKVATGTVYIYFQNKDVLINQLFLTLKKQKMDETLQVFDPTDPYRISFKKLWLNYLRISMRDPERMIFIEQFVHSSYLTKKTKDQSDVLLKPLEDFLASGVKQGILKKLPVELLTGQLVGPITEMVKLEYDNKLKITTSLMEESFQMAWSSVKQ